MKIFLEDDFGARKEIPVDALTSFCASEHAVECANCHRWCLDENAMEDEKGRRWYCGTACNYEYRLDRFDYFYGG